MAVGAPARCALVIGLIGAALAGCSSSSQSQSPAAEPDLTAVAATTVEPATLSIPATATPPASTSIAAAGTTTSSSLDVDAEHPCAVSTEPPATYEHIIWIWMENKNASMLDPIQTPFLAHLAAACGSAADYTDNGLHPSLPNYILATAGDAFGIADDRGPDKHSLTASNIFRQVRQSGRRAISYLDAMSEPCQLTSRGRYAVKHNPAAYFTGEDDRDACLRDNVPFEQFATDLATDDLAAFVSITPDLCNDMHDCPARAGDDWLRVVVTSILDSATYRAGRTALFIVWDESSGSGRMPFVAIAPTVPTGTVAQLQLSHPALLRFTEDALGLADHLGAAADAAELADAFNL